MAPEGSRRPAGGLEPAQEGFPAAASGLKSAPKWPRDECSGFEWPRERSKRLGPYRKSARLKSSQLESAIKSFIHRLVLYIYIYIYISGDASRALQRG